MISASETPLVLFEFVGDDWNFRKLLLTSIRDRALPDYNFQLGGSSGRNYAALWKPEHADEVRAWASVNGIRLIGALPLG